jgi:molybdopterin-binding protein
MAAVFQRRYLFKGSVGANVEYGLAVRGVPRSERSSAVASALARVGLAGYEERSALQLSGGEAQRVSLARALVLEPKVLLVDEPLASLDPLLKRRLTHDFATILRNEQVTVVYVTHDQDEALVVADRIAVMNAGRIVASGPAEEVVGLAEDEWTASFLGVEAATRGTVVGVSAGLARVRAAGAEVVLAGDLVAGAAVTFSVRPEDVLLFTGNAELPPGTARNHLAARVTSVEPRGATMLVGLDADGVRLASSVSRASVTDLGLRPGLDVLAVFKATAVRWRTASE